MSFNVNPPHLRKANYVRLTAKDGCASALADILSPVDPAKAELLEAAAFWYALRDESTPNRFAIFDLFADNAARKAYVESGGPALLRKQASTLVEHEVLANVGLYAVVGSVVADDPVPVTHVTVTSFQVEPGETDALEQLLHERPSTIAASDGSTPYWYGLRDEQRSGHYAVVALHQGKAGHVVGERDLEATALGPALMLPMDAAIPHVSTAVVNYEVIYSK